jgi:choline-sulfatase
MERLCLSEEIPHGVEEDEFLQELHAAGFAWAEEPHGMRSHMYYLPQVSQLPDQWHTTTWTGRKTVEFIESQRGGAQPWLCWVGFMKPHPPFDPTVPFNTLYDPVETPPPVRGPQCKANCNWYQMLQNRGKWMDLEPDPHLMQAQKAHYWACVSMVDRQVGLILDALEHTGQRDNTLILFTSDHGELLGDHHSWGKRSWYEGSARVPFIVSWPGRIKQGQRRDLLVDQTDILPTFLAAAGLDAPSWAPGVNLLELCRDDAARSREFLCGQLGEKGLALYLALDAEWKYAYCAADGKEQLFHYASDPDELVNRASDPQAAEAKARLFGALVDYWRRDGYEDPVEDGAWRPWPRGTSGLERLLEQGEAPHGIAGGYRQYAAWNKRADNVFRPEGRVQ